MTVGVANSAATAAHAEEATDALYASKLGTGTVGSSTIPIYLSSGAPVQCGRTIPLITLNGSINTAPSFYAPTSVGTKGYILQSNGSGAPSWTALNSGIESGDGYIRFSSGIQICWGQADHGSDAYDWSASISFAKSFAYTPYVVATPISTAGSGQMCEVSNVSITGVTIKQYSKPSAGGKARYVNYIAIGKYN